MIKRSYNKPAACGTAEPCFASNQHIWRLCVEQAAWVGLESSIYRLKSRTMHEPQLGAVFLQGSYVAYHSTNQVRMQTTAPDRRIVWVSLRSARVFLIKTGAAVYRPCAASPSTDVSCTPSCPCWDARHAVVPLNWICQRCYVRRSLLGLRRIERRFRFPNCGRQLESAGRQRAFLAAGVRVALLARFCLAMPEGSSTSREVSVGL